jgi:hypothetical protein
MNVELGVGAHRLAAAERGLPLRPPRGAPLREKGRQIVAVETVRAGLNDEGGS